MKRPLFVLAATLLAATLVASGQKPKKNEGQKPRPEKSRPGLVNYSYRIETIATPPGLTAEVSSLAFLSDGRLVAGFHRGEVYIYDPAKKAWKLFAEGLHDPLGLVVISNSEIIVMQRPELTRIRDTNGDGMADSYETICDDFGLSGNYHEFAFGPVMDKNGDFFVALNTASGRGGVHSEMRGEYDPRTLSMAMHSCVPWRGWVVKITPDGRLIPWASGFRSPNGLCFDAEGNLFVCDNQGDWVGTSPLYHVEKDRFYGHPAALAWKKGEIRTPSQIPVEELDATRTRGAVLFPQNIMANSPTQPLLDSTGGRFGPFAGQMFAGEMNHQHLLRLMLEKVHGQWQGACIPFIDASGLRTGNNRMAFAPDGSLWVGQTDHGWPGDKGIQHITWTGRTPFDVLKMNLTHTGFDITFTRPVEAADASTPAAYQIHRYDYAYHPEYGSNQFDLQDVPVKSVILSPDRKRVSLELEDLVAGRIYELHFEGIQDSDGGPLLNPVICYTLNHLLDSTRTR